MHKPLLFILYYRYASYWYGKEVRKVEKGSCLYLGKIAVVTILVYLSFRFFLPLCFPFLLAYLLACLLKRPVCFLAKRMKIKPAIGGGILLFLFVLFIQRRFFL